MRVDSAFAAAERYVLQVNTGRTCMIPVAANGVCVEPFTSWVEHVPGWLSPERTLFEALLGDCNWRSSQRLMYERVVDVPRMLALPTPGARSTTLLHALAQLLSTRYGHPLTTSSLALYRDGNDSVAPHGDKLGKLIENTVVCILSLGHPRVMRLRPKAVARGALPTHALLNRLYVGRRRSLRDGRPLSSGLAARDPQSDRRRCPHQRNVS